jgi:hypothetical protein
MTAPEHSRGSTARKRAVVQGGHEELLRFDGTYARLWQHQSGGFLDGDEATAMLPEASGTAGHASGAAGHGE